jgi:ketosteroid isomerase-like protein
MAQNGLDLIRQGVAALNRRDIDAMLATLDPDVLLEPLRAVHDGTVYRGHQGLKDWLADMEADWEYQRVEVLDVHAVQPDQIVLEAVLHVRYRESGVEVAAPGAWLCRLRDGAITRITFFGGVAGAIEAAGAGEAP